MNLSDQKFMIFKTVLSSPLLNIRPADCQVHSINSAKHSSDAYLISPIVLLHLPRLVSGLMVFACLTLSVAISWIL